MFLNHPSRAFALSGALVLVVLSGTASGLAQYQPAAAAKRRCAPRPGYFTPIRPTRAAKRESFRNGA